MTKVLVVVAHPDDETYLCGGSIVRHVQNGDTVHLLVIADGETSRDGEHDVAGKKTMLANACKALGIHQAEALDFEDQQLDTVPRLAIIKEIEKRVEEFKPDVVYTHCKVDMNLDHRIVCDAVMVACRTVNSILMGETPNWTVGFNPNWFVNIENQWLKKCEAIGYYRSELREYPHPRSMRGIAALAEYRGIMGRVKLAEAFELVRAVA